MACTHLWQGAVAMFVGFVDWPVYPRSKGTMQGSECARNSAARVAARPI